MFGDLNLIHMYETHGIFLLSLFVLIMYSMCYSMTINLIWIELNWIELNWYLSASFFVKCKTEIKWEKTSCNYLTMLWLNLIHISKTGLGGTPYICLIL